MKQNYYIESYEELNNDLISLLQSDLNELDRYCFQDLNFLKYYVNLNNFKKKKLKLIIIKCLISKKIIYILPFEVQNFYGINILQWLGTNDFDYCASLINFKLAKKINFKTLWKEIQKKIDGIDLIFLNKQPETINNFNNPFVKFLNSQHYSDVFIIKLFKDFNNYLNSFANKKFLKEFLRLNKKLYADHRVEIKLEDKKNKIISPRDIIIKKIEQINSLKIKTDLSSELGVFYNNLYEKEKFSSIFTLSIDQEIVAASYNFIYKDRFYYFIPVIFSNKYKKFSLGKILLYNLIKWSYEKKLFFFDFGLGNEDYKKYWSNFRQKLYRYIEFKTFKGFILSLLLRLYFFFKSFKKL